ncbi:MAG: GGDEF domain-containing protein [Candidatus Dormibacteraeota bacterium]|uniref:GGDEF domain-containing protein n=1 Tax=Candidatus Amunia macphersoniae TaxID=3127014 RepID=A0A934KKH5_9BACT|nr:GGDEF domain-containing protein [Candidatus Dormibacteraeota bacterium]
MAESTLAAAAKGEMVGKRSVGSGRAAALASAVMLAATLARLLTLPLPANRWWAELGLGLAGIACAALALRVFAADTAGNLIALAQALIPAAIAAGMVTLAAGAYDRLDVLTVLLFTAAQLGGPPKVSAWARVTGTLMVDGIFAAVWLTQLDGDLPTLFVATGFMAALQMVALARARAAGGSAETRSLRSSAHAATAERVGTAIDVLGVTRAVLETTLHSYPMSTHAAVLLHDPATARLRPSPLYLGPQGVRPLEADNLDFSLAPGEGLAGRIFSSSRPMVWPTAYDVQLAQANLSEPVRGQLLALRRGVTRCAVGAPLIVDDEVIGAYVITSNRQELVWSEEDLIVVSALASEAARAIERARRYERDLDQAHLDSVTGLANHRQLTRTLDKEVARARRLTTSLGVVFCDLDLFKMVNDTYGHAAGDRVLTILARVLEESLRREDSAARYGGDEFVCVLPGADREESDAIGKRISSSFEARVREDPELRTAGVTISCGVAIFPDDGGDVEALLEHADAAMRVVKRGRRAGFTHGWRVR